jgi:LacI family transcriptional regulator
METEMGRVTLMDVARHCGVSRATVSLVLNDSPLVAEATRARVQAAMSELGYVYNRAAASLRTHRSDAIGVVLTQITNPYFAEFATGLQDVLAGSGTVPLLGVSNEDRELQHRLMKSLVERNVDSIVLVPAHGTTATDLPDLLGTPLVLMARRLPGADVDYVGAQNRDGGYAAAEHLYSHGCRSIAFFGGFADASAREERAAGVHDFLAEHESSLDSYDQVSCERLNRPSLSSVAVPARETGRRAAQLVLERATGSTESTVYEELPTKLQPRETCGCPRPKHQP